MDTNGTATTNFRWHKVIHSYEWTTNWTPRFTMTLEQEFINSNGESEWRALPVFEEEAPDCIHYG